MQIDSEMIAGTAPEPIATDDHGRRHRETRARNLVNEIRRKDGEIGGLKEELKELRDEREELVSTLLGLFSGAPQPELPFGPPEAVDPATGEIKEGSGGLAGTGVESVTISVPGEEPVTMTGKQFDRAVDAIVKGKRKPAGKKGSGKPAPEYVYPELVGTDKATATRIETLFDWYSEEVIRDAVYLALGITPPFEEPELRLSAAVIDKVSAALTVADEDPNPADRR